MNFIHIRQLVRFIEKYKSSKRLPLDLYGLKSEDSKLGSFYRIITTSDKQKDEEAAFELYGNDHPGTKYKSLKDSFISRSLNNLISLNLHKAGISKRTTAVYRTYKNLFASSVLMPLGMQSAAVSIARKGLITAEKYELYHPAIQFLKQLRSESLQEGKTKEYRKYSDKLENTISLLEAQLKIERLENEIRIHFTNTLYINEKYEDDAKEALEQIEQLLQTHETYLGRISYYRLRYLYRQIANDAFGSIAACDEALDYLQTKPDLTAKSRIGEFVLYKLDNYLLLNDHEKGKERILSCAQYFGSGSNNWFTYKEKQFFLEMNTLSFFQAQEVLYEVTTDKSYSTLRDHIRDRWIIYGLYLEYAQDPEGLVSLYIKSKKPSKSKRRKTADLIFKVPSKTSDKQGFYVSVLILNILILLEAKDFEALEGQLEILTTYRFKFLTGKHSAQTFLLLRLIDLMKASGFDLRVMGKKMSFYERKLEKSKPGTAEILETLQIIPPIWMWRRMKAALILWQDY